METDTTAAAAAAGEATAAEDGAAAASDNCSPAREAAGETGKERDDEEIEEAETAQQVDLSPLETCERATDSPPWDLQETLKLFVFCLLALGSKTQTHMHRLLSNYIEVFSLIEKQTNVNALNGMTELDTIEGDEQVDIHPAVLEATQKYWINSQQK